MILLNFVFFFSFHVKYTFEEKVELILNTKKLNTQLNMTVNDSASWPNWVGRIQWHS
jgi:hypothetical protein